MIKMISITFPDLLGKAGLKGRKNSKNHWMRYVIIN